MGALVKWREAYQLQRIASPIERAGERLEGGASLADELSRLKLLLDSGAITPEEYEKKLLGEWAPEATLFADSAHELS